MRSAGAKRAAPRDTEDVDLVVYIRRRDGPRLKTARTEIGAKPARTDGRERFETRFVRFRVGSAFLDSRVASTARDRRTDRRALE